MSPQGAEATVQDNAVIAGLNRSVTQNQGQYKTSSQPHGALRLALRGRTHPHEIVQSELPLGLV
jgi:hypothetical protein